MTGNQLVIQYHEKITTTSLVIAEVFQKEHKNVLRAIETLECSEEFSRLNFEPSNYSVRGKLYPYYFITRDGFSMLAMSFTGKKATQFKEAFIKQFNLMEEELKKLAQQPRTPVLIPTYQQRILSDPTTECPTDRWNIFDQSHDIMLFVEKHVGSVSEYDLVDGSIGIHWSRFRKGKSWAKTVTHYYHKYKDKRGKQSANCFDYSELPFFKKWLKDEYKVLHLGEYLINKFTRDKQKTLLGRAKDLIPKMLPA